MHALGLCSRLQDSDVRGVRLALVLDQCLLQFVIEFEVASWQYLEDGVAVVLEEEQIVVGFVLGLDVCEALSSEETFVEAVSFKTFD